MAAKAIRILAAVAAVSWAWAGPASAQRSLFDAPPTTPAQATPPSAPEPTGETKPKPRPKPRKPRGPVPARALTIDNAGASTLSALEISADGKSAKLSKPLGPKKKTVLKLPAFKSCGVSVLASFDGQAGESSDVDICKDKTIRFSE